jgi:hypothetical protein
MHARGPNFFSFGFCRGERFFVVVVVPNVFTLDSHWNPNGFPPRSQSVPKDVLNSITLLSHTLWPKLNFDIKMRNTPFKKNTHTHTQTHTNLWVPIPINRINNMCPQFIVLATYWLLTRLSSWLLITYHLVIDFFDNQLNWYSFGIEFSKF